MPTARFRFVLPRRLRPVLRLFGVTERSAWAELDERLFTIRFGFWVLRTPVENLAGAEVTGPYQIVKVFGVRLSLVDRGITFGTRREPGACVRFRRPVPAADPLGLLRHPGATVTVEDPDALVRAVRERVGPDPSG